MADDGEARQGQEGVPETPRGAEELVPIAQVRGLTSANETLQARITELEQQLDQLSTQHSALSTELVEAQRQGVEHFRRALLAEHAGQVVPELVAGTTAEELVASVETARAAFQRAAEAARRQLQEQRVPAGNAARSSDDLATLAPMAKIAYGLRR
ncbi:MAG: hypothetical protein HY690_18540 [Chloroflexi bacterium]|nr:hypothetical protein [Chloroflexota bacterium]